MRAVHRDERGIAMITALLITVIVFVLASVAVGLAVYNNNQSARDRARLQTIDAAEAGINQATRTLGGSTLAALPCTITGQLDANPPVRYQVTVSYYASYPPSGTPMTCPPTAAPAAATFSSLGTSTGSSQAPRKLVSQVRLTPRYGGFDTAIFADSGLTTANNLNIHGNEGNDGDVYTNGDVTCDNSMALEGTLYAQGQVRMGNTCSVAEDVYARQAITMANNSTIGHDAISARSSIQLSNSARIANNATAATTITAASGAIGGSRVQNHTSPDPPARALPQIDFVASDWTAAGYAVQTFTTCSAAKSFIDQNLDDNPDTNYVIRITGSCSLRWENNSTVDVYQDLAIVFDWQVGFQNKSDWASGDGQEHSVLFINPWSTRTTCGSRNPAFATTNNTSFGDELRLFAYSPCGVSFNNSNRDLRGQIMAGQVAIANNFDLTYAPIPVPGFGTVSGFDQDIAFQREVAP